MCGTVAWLQGKTCRDDEQFDLAAWFLSLKNIWLLHELMQPVSISDTLVE